MLFIGEVKFLCQKSFHDLKGRKAWKIIGTFTLFRDNIFCDEKPRIPASYNYSSLLLLTTNLSLVGIIVE